LTQFVKYTDNIQPIVNKFLAINCTDTYSTNSFINEANRDLYEEKWQLTFGFLCWQINITSTALTLPSYGIIR